MALSSYFQPTPGGDTAFTVDPPKIKFGVGDSPDVKFTVGLTFLK